MMIVALLLVVFIFPIPKEISAQLSYKLQFESGLFFNSVESIYNETNTIYKILGNVKYKLKQKKSESLISFKIRPELFGNDFYSLKYGAQGNYTYFSNDVIWKSILSYNHFNYNFSSYNSKISSFTLLSGAEFNITESIPTQIFLGYSYQNIDLLNRINSDHIFLDSKIRNPISNYLNLSYGLFVEHFITLSNSNRSNKNYKEKGWYLGPQINVNYLRGFVLNLEYKFLVLSSTNLIFPSFEHRINAFGGLLLNKQFSFFLLIDYYFRKTELRNTENNSILLLPTKNENNIAIRINYKFIKHFSVYLKTGYFRENLVSDNKKLDGMNIMFGIELKN